MKKKFLFSLMLLFFLMFLAQGGWISTEVRLDTGDTPGANDSWGPQISSSSGSNVYVVWFDDRNVNSDIYFNYSTDGGVTWQATDIRLDTGDTPGANQSWKPQISSSGSNVYVVWEDDRNGERDIYFNYSIDGGATWQTTDIRLDTGNSPGANDSWAPKISSSGSNVYVVWQDDRNGERDIYFNYSIDGGATWQTTDIRLDTGDMAGVHDSNYPEISSSGNNVYVAWGERRDDAFEGDDIYFNYSVDGGATWQATDIRLDVGDTPGASDSYGHQISSTGSNVYVVWEDFRDGWGDVYFNYSTDGGASWQATDFRLDTGDTPGANHSVLPHIDSRGSDVYVAWHDFRNGEGDIYFNYSTDGGATWQTTDIRLDTGDSPGAKDSFSSEISSNGSNVYVVWEDFRDGWGDVYFNYSTDGGASWQATDFRLDTGDTPGANHSANPQINGISNSAYVVWRDHRNGYKDIYFNEATLPMLDIKANGLDGPITISKKDVLLVSVSMNAGVWNGYNADIWLVVHTPFSAPHDWYHYDLATKSWKPGKSVSYQGAMMDIDPKKVLNQSGLKPGFYTFYFGVDMIMNGSIDYNQAFHDKVGVTITK